MNKLDAKLETLKELLEPLLAGASPQKKRYARELFLQVITELNLAELTVLNLKAKLNGFVNADDYRDEYEKALDILVLMGASDISYGFLSRRNMRWICEHNDNQSRPFTFVELYQVEWMLRAFEGVEDRMPESAEELKQYFKNASND
jgi:hypothetical protein